MSKINPKQPRLTALVWGVPILLCAVACLQIFLAMTKSLSPWKGGGFGMFSTVDSPDARFLRIYLINGGEETAVVLPDSLKMMGREVQTIPTPALLSKLAQQLAQGSWAPYRMTDPVRGYQNTQKQSDDADGDNLSGFGSAEDVVKTLPDGQLVFPKLLRMREKGEPGIKSDEAVAFQRVRVEVWKYTLDVHSSDLKATKYLEATVDAKQ